MEFEFRGRAGATVFPVSSRVLRHFGWPPVRRKNHQDVTIRRPSGRGPPTCPTPRLARVKKLLLRRPIHVSAYSTSSRLASYEALGLIWVKCCSMTGRRRPPSPLHPVPKRRLLGDCGPAKANLALSCSGRPRPIRRKSRTTPSLGTRDPPRALSRRPGESPTAFSRRGLRSSRRPSEVQSADRPYRRSSIQTRRATHGADDASTPPEVPKGAVVGLGRTRDAFSPPRSHAWES